MGDQRRVQHLLLLTSSHFNPRHGFTPADSCSRRPDASRREPCGRQGQQYLVETKDDMVPPVNPVDPFPLPPTLPVPDDLENEIANKLANKLRAAGSDYSGSDYGWFDTLLSVGKKVLPKVGDIVDEVGKELDIPTMSTIGKGISKVAGLV